MNFADWQREIENNLVSIIHQLHTTLMFPITQPDIDRLQDKVDALQQMYDNLPFVLYEEEINK